MRKILTTPELNVLGEIALRANGVRLFELSKREKAVVKKLEKKGMVKYNGSYLELTRGGLITFRRLAFLQGSSANELRGMRVKLTIR